MAYGVLYEFHRTSTNGADMLITISQKGYNGAVKKRALGRAPVIKRDNNGHIYGTSCELYAECLVDGEFSHLYTSDAYEYKVEVYKNNTLLWAGFVSPELYSEPDIAPPYDVQIIATDGLGELKNYNFNKRGVASILDHIKALMSNTGIDLGFNVVSGLRYIDENGAASAIKDILNVKLDLDHEEGNTCYDVLQGILSSLNANITQHNGSYLMFRETDFISKAGANGVEAFTAAGNNINLGVASFGTMKANQWWPVGQLSTVIEPAKNQIVLKSPNHYKGNVLRFDNWTTSEMASFSEAENAYILPGANSYITQTVDFGGHQVGYRLGLRVRARNVGTATEEEQNIGLKVEMEGQTPTVGPNYWLVKPATGGRRPTSGYMWRNTESSFEEDLTTPSEAEDASDAQDIDIVLPLYREGLRAFAYAKRIKLTIFNPKGLYNIHVYDVSLVKYEQIKGYEANVTIDNMARESESDVDLTITAGDLAPAAGNVFMTGLPLRPTDSEVITKWQIGNDNAQDYLAIMAFDYSRGISLPRMKYSGILNVPGSATGLPTLFLRDGTYYFPHTYSYDLYSDEITVELISISAADVSLSSVAISQSAEAVGTMGATTGGTSGGGGAVSIPRDKQMSDTSDNAVENKVIKAYVDQAKKDVEDLLASMWQLIGDRVITDKKTVVENDLIVEGDVATGGSGSGTSAAGTVTGVLVGSDRYEDVTAGLLDLTEAFNKIDVSEQLKDYLPLSGGVIDGTLMNPLTIKTSAAEVGIPMSVNNSAKMWVGWNSSYGAYLYNSASSKYLGIKDDGTPHFNGSTLIHSGNIKDHKAGDSTLLGGKAVNEFAYVGVYPEQGNYNYSMQSGIYRSNGKEEGLPNTNSGCSVIHTNFDSKAANQLFLDRTKDFFAYRRKTGGEWSAWKTIAFTDSTVAAANKIVTSGGADAVVVSSSGNVLIGTATDNGTGYKLQVSGGIHTTGNLTLTGFAKANRFSTEGNYGLWKGSAYASGLAATDIALVGTTIGLYSPVTMTSTLAVSGKTTISNDLVVSGDVSTGGSGTGTGAAGTVTGIAVNGQTYEPTAGIVTIPDYPTSLTWSAIDGRPTHLSDFTDDVVSGKYLPLSGGVIDGTLMNPLTIKTSAAEVGIPMSVNNSAKMWVGWNSSYGAYLYNSASSKYLGIKDDGTPHFNGSTLIHSGNIKDHKAGDSTLLGGKAVNEFAYVGVYPEQGNYNYSMQSGIYRSNGKEEGLPNTNSGCSVIHTNFDSKAANQLFLDRTKDFFAYRRKTGGEWSAWKTIAFTDSTVAAANKIVTSGGADAVVVSSSGNVLIGTATDNGTGYKLQVSGGIHTTGNLTLTGFAKANRFSTEGNYGLWKGSAYASGLAATDIALVGTTIGLYSPVTMTSTLAVSGKTTISNDLVVSGDVSTGGNGGGSSSGGSGDSLCLGPVELDMQSISSLGTFTQAQMDGFGLTTTVISNMLAGLYTKVINWGVGDVYDYNGFGVIGSIIRLYFRQGNGESVDYTYTLYYDKTKWTVTEN